MPFDRLYLAPCPSLHPTHDDFADPTAFLSRPDIQALGRTYGIVKIVPPAGWRPPILLAESFSFHTRLQKLGDLGITGRSRKFFLDNMNKHRAMAGFPPVPPTCSPSPGCEVHFYDLYLAAERHLAAGPGPDSSGAPGAALLLRRAPGDVVTPKQEPQVPYRARLAAFNAEFGLPPASNVLAAVFYSQVLPYARFLAAHGATDFPQPDPESPDACVICRKTHSPTTTLLCDHCDGAYHMRCLDPPLTQVPEGKWYCAGCLVGSGEYGFDENNAKYSLWLFIDHCKETEARLAAQFGDLAPDDLETLFWGLVESGSDIEVQYGADIHNLAPGEVSGFPTEVSRGYKDLRPLLDSLLLQGRPFPPFLPSQTLPPPYAGPSPPSGLLTPQSVPQTILHNMPQPSPQAQIPPMLGHIRDTQLPPLAPLSAQLPPLPGHLPAFSGQLPPIAGLPPIPGLPPLAGPLASVDYLTHPWNLTQLPFAKGSLLRHVHTQISGMTVPWIYVGSRLSTFCWHVEDHYTLSANYCHAGATKKWYGIPAAFADQFEAYMKARAPDLFKRQPDLLHQLVTLVSPLDLARAGIQVFYADQHPNEFVVTYPRVYHAGFNSGFNLNEAVNFTMDSWLEYGEQAVRDYRGIKKENVFDHYLLLENILGAFVGDPAAWKARLAVVNKCIRSFQAFAASQARRLAALTTDRVQVVAGESGEANDTLCDVCNTSMAYQYCRVNNRNRRFGKWYQGRPKRVKIELSTLLTPDASPATMEDLDRDDAADTVAASKSAQTLESMQTSSDQFQKLILDAKRALAGNESPAKRRMSRPKRTATAPKPQLVEPPFAPQTEDEPKAEAKKTAYNALFDRLNQQDVIDLCLECTELFCGEHGEKVPKGLDLVVQRDIASMQSVLESARNRFFEIVESGEK